MWELVFSLHVAVGVPLFEYRQSEYIYGSYSTESECWRGYVDARKDLDRRFTGIMIGAGDCREK